MSIGKSVNTIDRGTGMIKDIEDGYALVWFGGHQRNSYWYSLEELK